MPQTTEENMRTGSRLTRSNDRWVAGVCGGLAEFLGWSPLAVRALYVVVSIASVAFPGIIAYLVLWYVMPSPESRRLGDR
jgi:phage shock protein C